MNIARWVPMDIKGHAFRCASHLASYIDDLLRNGIQGVAEDEIDAKLDKAITIFRYISDKDVFENFYKNLLSKRLLGGKTSTLCNDCCISSLSLLWLIFVPFSSRLSSKECSSI
jgi:hypothetical protein